MILNGDPVKNFFFLGGSLPKTLGPPLVKVLVRLHRFFPDFTNLKYVQISTFLAFEVFLMLLSTPEQVRHKKDFVNLHYLSGP